MRFKEDKIKERKKMEEMEENQWYRVLMISIKKSIGESISKEMSYPKKITFSRC